tara:strand:- start:627 stop:935 length:309 start_codon:yes stop_codon:yes gene_type:complete
LEKGSGGTDDETRKANLNEQGIPQEERHCGGAALAEFDRGSLRGQREIDKGDEKERCVEGELEADRATSGEEVGIAVSQEDGRLKENDHCVPDGRCAPDNGQ